MLAAALSPFVLKCIAGLIVVVAIGSGLAYMHHKIYSEGRAAAVAEYKPMIEARDKAIQAAASANADLSNAVKTLRADYAEQGAAVATLKAKEAAAQETARVAIAKAAATSKFAVNESARLRLIAVTPTTERGTCEDVDSMLRRIARDRMRDNAAN